MKQKLKKIGFEGSISCFNIKNIPKRINVRVAKSFKN